MCDDRNIHKLTFLEYFTQFGVVPKVKDNDREKLLERKREKQKAIAAKEDEKMEKRKAKEDAAKLRKLIDKEKELEKKMKRKSKPNNGKGATASDGTTMPEFVQSEKNLIPLFLEKCIEFIEQEGVDSEGIYRVPGNRAHVELLYQKLQEGEFFSRISIDVNTANHFSFTRTDPNADIEVLDIPVNAVATALKDFFSKHLPPLFDKDLMTELEDIAGRICESIYNFDAKSINSWISFVASIVSRGAPSSQLNMEVKTDRSSRLLALRGLLNKLAPVNFQILKYIFQHFVR